MTLLIQSNTQGFLLNDNFGFRDIGINALCVAIHDNLLLELNAVCGIVRAHYAHNNIQPIGTVIFIFFAFSVPLLEELARCFSLFGICHNNTPQRKMNLR
ncbi:MAG: hypothetical protein MJZ57_09685 [Bacteroidales bacterium]|nr:hypothetical protein [Bacteroidales bacterium]